jgi:type II secretory pathway pseudopilin PulG
MQITGYRMKTRGFILLELIIVLFFITVIIGISTVLFSNALPTNRLHATVRNISSTIRQARALAQIHSEGKTVIIDLDAKKYGIEGYNQTAIPSDISIKVIDPVSGEIYQGIYRFFFSSSGGIEGGTIVVWNQKKMVTIQPDPIVGTVVIK